MVILLLNMFCKNFIRNIWLFLFFCVFSNFFLRVILMLRLRVLFFRENYYFGFYLIFRILLNIRLRYVIYFYLECFFL